jgi:ABC-type uncharacterized transport system permease subunit
MELPKVRKALKILSVVSCIMLVLVAAYSLVIIIKYKDYPYFSSTTFEQRWMWERYDPKTYSLWKEYWFEYNADYALIIIAMVFFCISGIPIWRRNLAHPSNLLSKREKALLVSLMKLLKSFIQHI